MLAVQSLQPTKGEVLCQQKQALEQQLRYPLPHGEFQFKYYQYQNCLQKIQQLQEHETANRLATQRFPGQSIRQFSRYL